jgi:hypothetical protein
VHCWSTAQPEGKTEATICDGTLADHLSPRLKGFFIEGQSGQDGCGDMAGLTVQDIHHASHGHYQGAMVEDEGS